MSRIIIVGSGVVGTATGKGFKHHGHEVTFIDVDPARIERLQAEGHRATDELDLSGEEAFIFLTLPTPNVGHRYDLSALVAGTGSVGKALRAADTSHTVVMKSTVPPGTCEGVIQPLLERSSGKRVGEGFALASNPEFLRAASALEDFLWPWMTVVGSRSRRTLERLRELFQPFGGAIRTFSNPAAAEMVKCCHNIYNATKISFWNEMWRVGRRVGLDADEVATTVAYSSEASINPEYGIRGGAPYGGVCLPKDTKGFLGFAAGIGIEMPMLTAVVQVNDEMERAMNEELASVGADALQPAAPAPAGPAEVTPAALA